MHTITFVKRIHRTPFDNDLWYLVSKKCMDIRLMLADIMVYCTRYKQIDQTDVWIIGSSKYITFRSWESSSYNRGRTWCVSVTRSDEELINNNLIGMIWLCAPISFGLWWSGDSLVQSSRFGQSRLVHG